MGFKIYVKDNNPPPERKAPKLSFEDTKPRKRMKDRIFHPEAIFAPGQPKIVRVFPERTAMTPDDSYVFVGHPPLGFLLPPPDMVDEVHISVVFTWHKRVAENQLQQEWDNIYPGKVRIGGPAYDSIECPAGNFLGSLYLKSGVTITSRGCPNNCWFCFVPKREGKVRELPIVPGFHVQDNNLTACKRGHVESVFKMLSEQRDHVNFSGGLECARILSHDWFVQLMVDQIKHIRQIFVAFDDEARGNVTRKGICLLREKGFTRRQIRCFVLAGYPENVEHSVEKDTIQKAIDRCERVWDWGALPFMMLYRGADFEAPLPSSWRTVQHEVSGPWGDPDWRKLQNLYTSPAVMFSTHNEKLSEEEQKDEDFGLIAKPDSDIPQEVKEEDEERQRQEIANHLKVEKEHKRREAARAAGQTEFFGDDENHSDISE
jgi:hypothetical protein